MGESRVIREPIVRTIRHPPKSVPNAIAPLQAMTTRKGTAGDLVRHILETIHHAFEMIVDFGSHDVVIAFAF